MESTAHPLKDLARDVVFCARKVGAGLELDIERFKRKRDEEKKRQGFPWPGLRWLRARLRWLRWQRSRRLRLGWKRLANRRCGDH